MGESRDTFDSVILGAGAAGLMTAIACARTLERLHPDPNTRPSIVLFDTRNRIGAKILMSGGTRCNVTNRSVKPVDYFGGPRHFVSHVLEAFKPAEVLHFFDEIGVQTVLEPSGKYFPVSHSGKTVLESLVRECQTHDVEFRRGVKIVSVKPMGEFFQIEGILDEGKGQTLSFQARRVVLCTGGLSYPETGSDGTGLEIAKTLGHTIVPTVPALTPLLTRETSWTDLSGISLEARLDFYLDNKKTASSCGGLLFTHFGFSGPAALDLSRHMAQAKNPSHAEIKACFLPKVSETEFQKEITRVQPTFPSLLSMLTEGYGLPRRLVELLLNKPHWTKTRNLPKGWQPELVKNLFYCPLEVTGVYGYKKAEVTAGGVDLKEVTVGTMESKKIKGLYFAGEILDVDGRIGGFNFQWAWSSGTIAGMAVARSLS